MSSTKKKKLTKKQKKDLDLILAWYNFARTVEDERNKANKKRIEEEAIDMIEDIILN